MAGQAPAETGLTGRVLHILTTTETPLTPAQVREELAGDWAYTTVMTVLSRLVTKGVARRRRAGRAYAYSAVDDEAEQTARRMTRLLEGRTDRAAVLARFVGVLSDSDELLLGELLAAPRHRRGPDR